MLFIFILITGRIKSIVAFLKKDIPSLFYIQCVTNREHLIAIHLSLNYLALKLLLLEQSMQLKDIHVEEYTRVLLDREVRWLSKGKYLIIFYELYNSILEHMNIFDINMYSKLIKIECGLA